MQLPKAPSPIESIELGIVIELSPVSLKAVDSILEAHRITLEKYC